MAEQRIAVVTGGNRGIGLETCRQLATLGIRVILGSRDGAKGIAAAKELSAIGLPVEAHQLDVSSAKSIGECMNWVRRDVGRIDILVNNAGIMVEEGDADPLEELQRVVDHRPAADREQVLVRDAGQLGEPRRRSAGADEALHRA